MSAGTSADQLASLAGIDLGTHVARYDDAASILYALTVGARPNQLDLVYERDLRALPTYGCALGLWAVEAAGALGVYDPGRSLHASQRLVVHRPLSASGTLEMSGRIAGVYDKGKAGLVAIEVTSEAFTAGYDIFLPGLGGWGGDRGPSSERSEVHLTRTSTYSTPRNLAALYRLTGDRHPVHVDPDVAAANGFDRPILHGLCTLGIAAREVAEHVGANPADLASLEARLTSPVVPGDELQITSGAADDVVHFEVAVGDAVVISAGRATFGPTT